MSSGLATPDEYITNIERAVASSLRNSETIQRKLAFGQLPDSPQIEQYRYDPNRGVVVRSVMTRGMTRVESEVVVGSTNGLDAASAFDAAWIRSEKQPKLRGRRRNVRIVDLFSGCGGMTIGVTEACRALGYRAKPLLAVDTDETALGIYQSNIPVERALSDPIESILDSDLGEPLSESEETLKKDLGHVDMLVGGPPCQGHSDLNNHTRRIDSRNALFLKMARFAEVCRPEHILIENVLGVRYDKGQVLEVTRNYLRNLGYNVDADIIRAEKLGAPQSRPRVFLIASRKIPVKIKDIVRQYKAGPRDFMWACSDLINKTGGTMFDRPSDRHPKTQKRIDYLFDNGLYELPNDMRPACHHGDHTYYSVYGRIRPHLPAPTITTGFMTMGRGRFVHPTEPRTLTPHEGARIQGFPDWFRFGDLKRTDYETLIGNAVPPKFTYVMALELLR
jgi:DNA (cytosine-5)-methyltransferase 1